MHDLPLVLGKITNVAYLVVMTYEGQVVNHDHKIYKRKGDAIKHRNQLNKLTGNSGYEYKIYCAHGWYPTEDDSLD